jgi:hypothetical protein
MARGNNNDNLREMTPRQLKEYATELGCDWDAIQGSDDVNDVMGYLVELVGNQLRLIEAETEARRGPRQRVLDDRQTTLEAELRLLKPRQLKVLAARRHGLSEEEISEADDHEDVREVLIQKIMQADRDAFRRDEETESSQSSEDEDEQGGTRRRRHDARSPSPSPPAHVQQEETGRDGTGVLLVLGLYCIFLCYALNLW